MAYNAVRVLCKCSVLEGDKAQLVKPVKRFCVSCGGMTVKVKRTLLKIENEDIEVFSGSALEYPFPADKLAFIRCDGDTRVKHRRKNILIYNPDQKPLVTVLLNSNLSIKSSWIECIGADYFLTSKQVSINVKATGCSFARITIKDPNNSITYLIKICVLNMLPKYLEDIQTCYLLDVPKNIKRSTIQAIGLKKKLTINPGCEIETAVALKPNEEYVCNYNQTLLLSLDEEDVDTDSGTITIRLKCGAIFVPLQVKDEPIKPLELTGISAFKWKHSARRSLEYRDGKIVSGTTEYFAKSPFKDSLALENELIRNNWLAATDTINGLEECQLDLPSAVTTAYHTLIN